MFQCLTVWLINHNQSTHTLQDSKKLQETIERIREEAK